jgi:phospholipid/cholesterol/gamma-HCH transport system substrate-binding protein
MMKVKFNKFERVAGLFVLVAIIGFVVAMATVAIQQGWFEQKVYFVTKFQNVDGVHPGTNVQMAGLKAGSVEEVELLSNNIIQVRFYVLGKFSNRVKEDSYAQLIRPFIIGDRVLELSVGADDAKPLQANAVIPSHETIDLMSIFSGRNLHQYLSTFSGMLENLKTLAEAFLDKERTQSFIKMFDRIDPLLKNLNTMSVEVIKLSKMATKDENLAVVLKNVAKTTDEINDMLPVIKEKAPEMAKDITKLVKNMNLLTDEFKVVLPALAEIAPHLPRTSRRAVEALDEAVVLMKAMQKTFLVKGSAQEVREEEMAREAKQKERKPADSGE